MITVPQKVNGKIQRAEEREERKSRRERIRELLSKLENDFQPAKTKITLADYIRLTQLERELEEEEQPREIIITWIEPPEKRDIEE